MAFKIPSGADKGQFSIRVDENDFNIIEKLSKKSKKSKKKSGQKPISGGLEKFFKDKM